MSGGVEQGVQLEHRVAQGGHDARRQALRGALVAHELTQRPALDELGHDRELVARAEALDQARNAVQDDARALGVPEPLVRATDPGGAVDALTDEGAELAAGGAAEPHELRRLERGRLERALDAPAVRARSGFKEAVELG